LGLKVLGLKELGLKELERQASAALELASVEQVEEVLALALVA
jgi:hypothetical protein